MSDDLPILLDMVNDVLTAAEWQQQDSFSNELRQVLTHQRLLLRVLLEEPLGDDVGHILARDAHLLETVLDPPEAVRSELEARVVEKTLLNTGDKAEARALTELPDRAEEVQVSHQLLLAVGAEVIEQLVKDEE